MSTGGRNILLFRAQILGHLKNGGPLTPACFTYFIERDFQTFPFRIGAVYLLAPA